MNDRRQISKAAENRMTADVIAYGLRQAEANGPDEADAQRIVEHGLVVLAKGDTGINCSCLRQPCKNIAHDELYLEQDRVCCQKLAAEGRALVHEAVDHDNHAEHAHCEMRATLHHLAAGGAGEDFPEWYGCERQGLVLPVEIKNGNEACDICNTGGSSDACNLEVQHYDEEHVEYEVNKVAGECREHSNAYMQRAGEPALRRLEDERQRHYPDEQAVVALKHRFRCSIGIKEQQRRAPDRFLQNDKGKTNGEGGKHAAQKSACEQLGVVVAHSLRRKAAGGDFQKAEEPINSAEDYSAQ